MFFLVVHGREQNGNLEEHVVALCVRVFVMKKITLTKQCLIIKGKVCLFISINGTE